jgi:hypothetical protein
MPGSPALSIFLFDRTQANAERLYQALSEFWGGSPPGVGSAAELTQLGLVIQYGVPPNRIDLINAIDGVTFEEAWAGRVEASIAADPGDVPVAYLGLRELLRNKEAAGRPRDLDDLAYLRQAGC